MANKIYLNHTLEEYNKKYGDKNLKKVNKVDSDKDKSLLNGKSWWLINDIYYEVPANKGFKGWWSNLGKTGQIVTCCLAGAAVVTAVVVPTVISINKNNNKSESKSAEVTGSGKDFIKEVNFTKQNDGTYKGKIEIVQGKSKDDIKEIVIKAGNKVLTKDTDYTMSDSGDVIIKAGVITTNDNITIEIIKKDPVIEYTITFKVDDKIIKTETVKEGEKVNKPTDPTPEKGYKFIGWFNDDKEFKFDSDGKSVLSITSSLILTAKFGLVYDYLVFTRIGTTNTCEVSAEGTVDIPSDLVIPDVDPITGYSVVKVTDFGFAYQDTLTSVTLPTTITEIGNSAFIGCTQLVTADLDTLTNLKRIDDSAFSGTAITKVVIPESVNHIGVESFGGCKLTSIKFKDNTYSWNLINNGQRITLYGSTKVLPSSLEFDALLVSLTTTLDVYGGNYSWDEKYDFYDVDWRNALIEGLQGESAYSYAQTATYIEIGKLSDHNPETEFSSYAIKGVNIAEGKRGIINFYFDKDNSKKLYVLSDRKIGFDDTDCNESAGIFNSCEEVTEMNLNNMDTTCITQGCNLFQKCKKLKSLDLSSFITKNWTNMRGIFSGCTALETIDISSFDTHKVTNIRSIFESCSSLKTIYASENFVTSQAKPNYKTNLFLDCSTNLVGGNGTTWSSDKAKDDTFAKIDKEGQPGYFTDIKEKPTEDKYFTFSAIEIVDEETGELTKVAYSIAAKSDENLPENIIIPSSHKEAGDLNSLPVREVGDSGFLRKTNIKEVHIPYSIKKIGNSAFNPADKGTMNIEKIVFKEGLEEISDYAFMNCPKITSLTFPSTLKTIGSNAFAGASTLETLLLNEGLLTIGEEAFSQTKITTVTLPSTITSIGDSAFNSCDDLISVDASNLDSIPTLGDYAFGTGVSENFKIYVKSTMVDSFKAASGWNAYTNNIVAKP